MATFIVPPGNTLASVISSASIGDVVVLQDGTHTGNFTFKQGVHLIAGFGATPVCTGTFNVAVGAGNLTLIRGLTFDTGNNVSTLHNAPNMRFDQCTFRYSPLSGNSTGQFTFIGCTTLDLYAELLGADDIWHGCLLLGATFFDSNNDTVLRHCTFVNRVSISASQPIQIFSQTLDVRDCIFDDDRTTDPYLNALSSGTAQRCVFWDAGVAPTSGLTLTNCKTVTDVRFRDTNTWRLRQDSPARNMGGAGTLYGPNRMALGSDAGCFTYYGDTTAVFAPWILADPAYGFNAADAAKGPMIVARTPQTLHDIFDVGAWLAYRLTLHFVQPLFTWHVSATGQLVLANMFNSATGSLSTNLQAAPHFGILSQISISGITLRADPRSLLTDLAFEAPTAPFIPARAERFDFGQTHGADLPANSTRRYCQFRVSTAVSGTYAHDVQARTVFNRWFSGSPLRVYRRWDESAPWSATNVEGYDDIVSLGVDGSEYAWYTPNLTSYEITFEGVANE